MRHYHWAALAWASLLIAGCGDVSGPREAANPDAANPGTADPQTTSETETAAGGDTGTDTPGDTGGETQVEIPLEIKSWDELQEWIAGQRGKVVVIDVWSTFCPPCIKEFPNFVEFHRTSGDQVVCASLSLDFFGGEGSKPEDVRPKVMEFLASQNATMQNFISRDTDEIVLQHIDTAAIPASLVFDREGKLYKVFNNDDDEYGPEGFNYADDIQPLVEQLLQ